MAGKIFYISDLHISHKNIINFDSRPFATIEENDETIMKNWNATVSAQDTVYVLGDLHWGKEMEACDYIKLLNGNKVLIRGNHDPKQPSKKFKSLFADIKDYKEITDSGRHVIMSHYPIMMYKSSYDPKTWMLHGHVHNTREAHFTMNFTWDLIFSCKSKSDNRGQIMNVGCMMPWMDYTPKTLDEITEAWKELYGKYL